MKKKLSKEERKLYRAKEIYERVKDDIGLNGDTNEQIGQLIQECCNIQKEISEKNDIINKVNFEKASEFIRIDRATWSEFVNLTAKKYYGRLGEKQVDKYEDTCQTKRHIANLKQSFYDSYLSDRPLKVLDETNNQSYDFDNEENKEFQDLMEETAKIKDYIVNILMPKYKTMYNCAFHLTEGTIKYSEFKDMVDWQCYVDSEDPNYPDKAWKVFEKFNRMIRLFDKYSNENSDKHLNDMKHEFGLTFELRPEHIRKHPWAKNDEDE